MAESVLQRDGTQGSRYELIKHGHDDLEQHVPAHTLARPISDRCLRACPLFPPRT